MPLTDIVQVSISTTALAVTQAGFGVPLILSHSATWVERVRFYADLTAVAVDFAATTPEHKAATAIFAQNPAPPKIAIGRAANKPTERHKITVSTVANSTAYKLKVTIGSTDSDVTFTSDATATNDEIAAGLVTALNAVAGKNYTASAVGGVGVQTVQVLADAAGNWYGIEVLDVNLLSLEQDHADPGLSADLTAIKTESNDWYALVTLFNSKAYVLGAAAWVESNKKTYLADTQDTPCATVALASATDVMKTAKDSAYARTMILYHPANRVMAGAAWAGKGLPLNAGSETWMFKTLAGIPATVVTGTHQTNIEAKFGNYYYTVAGVNITKDGKVSANEFYDVVRFRDWLEARIGERAFAKLAGAKKIPFTDEGITIIEGEVRAQLRDGVEVGGLAADPAPTVTVPKVSAVSAADKTARTLRNVKFSAVLAGAIHKLVIDGTITA